MATELKLRRGTTSQHQTFTGASSEVTVDSDKNTVVVHDGSTAGGFPLATEALSLEGRKEQIAQGFIQREGTRGDLDVDLAVAIELNLLGAPVAGGYYAGLIDTLTGNIIAADDYQTGLRYALIVSDKSLEGGRGSSPASGLPTGDLEWDTQDRTGEAGCFTCLQWTSWSCFIATLSPTMRITILAISLVTSPAATRQALTRRRRLRASSTKTAHAYRM